MSYRIALIDDDRNITASLKIALESEGYLVDIFNDGESGLQHLTKSPPDLAILDIKMPRLNGLEVLKALRTKNTQLPVIMLTSKNDESDEIFGLQNGADDYITKPFSQKLLLTRIRTLLRRTSFDDQPAQNTKSIGDLTLNDDCHTCTWQGHPLTLSVTEFLLLKALTAHIGHVKSRDQLIDAAYGETIYIDDRTIDSHIKRLRQKFKNIDPTFNHIETVYGIGYKYQEKA